MMGTAIGWILTTHSSCPWYEISYNPTLLRVDRTRKYSAILLSQLELLGGKGEGILLMLLNLFPQRVAFKFTPKEPGPSR